MLGVFWLSCLAVSTSGVEYHAHGELKSKHWLLHREHIPVDKAQYTDSSLSPSSEVWRIPLSEPTTVVFSLRNVGDSRFRMNATQASLRAFHRYSLAVSPPWVQLFGEDALVHPRSEITLEWRFTPDPLTEPVEFVLTLDVDYLALSDDDSALISQRYLENVMNVTVQLYDPSHHFDFQLCALFGFLGLLALVCGALVYSAWYVPSQIQAGHTPLSLAQLLDVAALRLRPLLGHRARLLSHAFWAGRLGWLLSGESAAPLNPGASHSKRKPSDWLAGTGAKRLKKTR